MESKLSIAIVVVAYNRIDSISRLLKSLEKANYFEEVPLIISIDKSNTTIVEDYAKEYEWKYGSKTVICHAENMGLRKHILSCGDHLDKYDALIILEDDLVVAPDFYNYSKAAVLKYQDCYNIAGIALYSYHVNPHTITPFFPCINNNDTYFIQWAPSWGQIWMKSQWRLFKEWYSTHSEEFTDAPHLPTNICHWGANSWLKYHTKYAIENGKYFVYPYVALSTTCGDQGEHAVENTSYFQSILFSGLNCDYKFADFGEDAIMYDAFFERKNILKSYSDVCIDIYGQKRNRQRSRYWLTTSSEDFAVVKKYRLMYKPQELNVSDDNPGEELFLYDTSKIGRAPKFQRNTLLYRYDVQNILRMNFEYSLKNLLMDVFNTFVKKYKRSRK